MTAGSDTFSTWSPDWIDPEADAIADAVFGDLARRIGPTPAGLYVPALLDELPQSRGSSRGSSWGLAVTGSSGTPTRGKQQSPRQTQTATDSRKKALSAGGRPLDAWDGDEQFVERVRELHGLQPVGTRARCILPCNDGPRASWVWRDNRGSYVYTSQPPTGQPLTLPLAAVHGSLIFERIYVPRPKDPTLATFKCDLLIRTGSIPAPTVIVPVLPPEASPLDKHLRQRVADLFAAKWAAEPGEPTMLARSFLSEWARVTPDQAREAIDRFKRWGTINLDRQEFYGGRPCNLWLPGSRS